MYHLAAIPLLADLARWAREADGLMHQFAGWIHDLLVRNGVPPIYADPTLLLRMPMGLTLFAPVALAAGLAPRRLRAPILLAASILFAFGIFGSLYVLAFLAAAVFTYVYAEIAVTISHYSVPRRVLEQLGDRLPDRLAGPVVQGVQDLERHLLPWGPRLFLAYFWIIATGALVYCFRRYLNWYAAMPSPVHFMHVAGFAFLYIKLLAYTRDVLYGHLQQRSPLAMVHWVFFHPTVRLGPIQRYSEFRAMMDALPERVSLGQMGRGALRLATGNLRILAVIVMVKFGEPAPIGWGLLPTIPPASLWAGFVHPQDFSTPLLLLGIVLQLLRFYLLFSAAADLAIGLCHLFGARLGENFDCPLLARNVADFWRRWHISLGAFCRNDIYIPLGGNRQRTTLNYFMVFLFIGLWHEPGWTFALWGFLQALGMAVHRWYRTWRERVHQRRPVTLMPVDSGWTATAKLVGYVLITQAYVAASFASLYDVKAGSLKVYETLLRRLVGADDFPRYTTPLVDWLNHQGAVLSAWVGGLI